MSNTHRVVKAGTVVNIKSEGYAGTVTMSCGDGEPTTTYGVTTMEGLVWLFRDQFTIAR